MNLIHVQVEVDSGPDPVNYDDMELVVAYFRQEPTEADWDEARGAASADRDEWYEWDTRKETPTKLSQALGIKRYYLG